MRRSRSDSFGGGQNEATERPAVEPARPTGLKAALIGRWATDRSCGDAIVYAADASLGMHSDPASSNREAHWSVAGDRVTWTDVTGRTMIFRITDIAAHSHTALRNDGRRERYIRC